MTETERKWVDRVREWKAGGVTAEEYARGRGFEGSTLRFWASRLKQVAKEPSSSGPSVRMARVKLAPRTEPSTVVVAVGKARVEVREGFDRALLREVIAAIGGDE
jgi:hypothetical protein